MIEKVELCIMEIQKIIDKQYDFCNLFVVFVLVVLVFGGVFFSVIEVKVTSFQPFPPTTKLIPSSSLLHDYCRETGICLEIQTLTIQLSSIVSTEFVNR